MTDLLRLDPRRGLVHGARAAVLTVPAVAVAGLAHASAGGCTSVLGLVLAAAVCWPMAVAVLRQQATLGWLLAWLLAAQGLTHVLLEWLCPDVVSGRMGLWEHLTMGSTPTMLGMHLLGVVLSAVVLSRADAALWCARALLRAAARAARLVAALPGHVVVPTPQPAHTAPRPTPTIFQDVWEGPRPARRGPPAPLTR